MENNESQMQPTNLEIINKLHAMIKHLNGAHFSTKEKLIYIIEINRPLIENIMKSICCESIYINNEEILSLLEDLTTACKRVYTAVNRMDTGLYCPISAGTQNQGRPIKFYRKPIPHLLCKHGQPTKQFLYNPFFQIDSFFYYYYLSKQDMPILRSTISKIVDTSVNISVDRAEQLNSKANLCDELSEKVKTLERQLIDSTLMIEYHRKIRATDKDKILLLCKTCNELDGDLGRANEKNEMLQKEVDRLIKQYESNPIDNTINLLNNDKKLEDCFNLMKIYEERLQKVESDIESINNIMDDPYFI